MGAVYADRFAYRGHGLTLVAGKREESCEMTVLDRVDRPLVALTQKPRILLVNTALLLHESLLQLLRSIPAIVETVSCCADMYRHEARGYSLVILALHSRSTETSEAAHFTRRRWNAARILLLEGECTAIDDWLYDQRVGPPFNPETVFDTAKRLMAEENIGVRHERLPATKYRS
jgi:hypothetical protein